MFVHLLPLVATFQHAISIYCKRIYLLTTPVLLHKNLTINASPQKIFAYWSDFRNFQQFIPIIESIEILDDKRSRWVIHAPLGHKVVFESLITTFEPGKNLVWESDHADGHARGDLRLTAQGESTRVELDFEYRLHRNWMQNIASLVSHFGFPSLTFDHGLAHIKEKIEKEANTQGTTMPK